MQPRTHAWLIPGRLAVSERPGGGGRAHRVDRRDGELAWWRDQGVRTIVSGMRSRHGLLEAALAGFRIRWHPVPDGAGAHAGLAALLDGVALVLESGDDPVLVHADRPGEWLTAIDAALRLRLGLARDAETALECAEADGLPVGSLAVGLVFATGEGQESPGP